MLECPYIRIGSGVHETSRYACVLTHAVDTNIPLQGYELLFYAGEQLIGRLSDDGRLQICKWYACDGYSPTLRMFGKWLRITPTPKKAGLFPAIFHDFTRQFLGTDGCPWTREETDTWFYDLLVAGGAGKLIAGTYYGAVSKTLGDIYHHFRTPDPTLWIIERKIQP